METTNQQLSQNAADEIEFVLRSSNRIQILSELTENTDLTRDQLQNRCNVSRTTLQRNLNALEEHGWIKNSGNEYRITPCGKLVTEEVLDLLQLTHAANQLQEVFRWISVSDLDIDLRLLADAKIWTPETGDPYVMLNRQVQLLRNADRIRGLIRVTGLHAHEARHEAVVRNNAHCELVVTPEVAKIHTSKSQYVELTTEMLNTDRFNLFVYESEIPYSIILIDGTVQISVDNDGDPQALLESAADEIHCWAKQVYQEYKQQADSIQ